VILLISEKKNPSEWEGENENKNREEKKLLRRILRRAGM
jgi:hypothetical protein